MANPTADHSIQVDDVRKSFGQQKVLDGVSIHVDKGETIAILGKSGTGKSVLLKVIIGLQSPDSGSVELLGQEMVNAQPNQLSEVRKKIGFLFQNAALYDSMTILQNVEFPLRHSQLPPQQRTSRAHELLASVGMDHDVDKLPSEISGGMQKRVGMARALALDPKVLMFDEPTAGLDPITAAEIGQLIQDLKQKRKMTAIVVTHDLRTAKGFADRMILLNEGRIRAEGTFADLQASKDEFVLQFLVGSA
jgi:phospholipid/cholesterol/gamma-HCH transport system ATP-binding protein